MKKGLRCSIYESKDIGNCSNTGISKRCKNVTLIANDVLPDIPEIFEPTDDAPAVIVVKRNLFSRDYFHVVPVVVVEGKVHSMMGGSYIMTSDSRFSFRYPLPLHDRVEQPIRQEGDEMHDRGTAPASAEHKTSDCW